MYENFNIQITDGTRNKVLLACFYFSKKKDSFRARGIPIMHLLLHAASAYNFFDQQCLVGICFMNFGWFLSVKYIGWIFNNINFGIYWCNIGASLIFFFWSYILIKWRSIDIFCNNFTIITYSNELFVSVWFGGF